MWMIKEKKVEDDWRNYPKIYRHMPDNEIRKETCTYRYYFYLQKKRQVLKQAKSPKVLCQMNKQVTKDRGFLKIQICRACIS